MLRQVTLRNFRGFSALVAPAGRVTAIIGSNSRGKTSVLHAIRLAADALALALESDETNPHEDQGTIIVLKNEVLADPTRLISLSDWHQIFTDGRVGDGVTAEIDLQFEKTDSLQRLRLILGYGRNAQAKATIEVECQAASIAVQAIAQKSKYRPSTLLQVLRASSPITAFVPAFYGVTRTEEFRTRPVVDRALGGGDQSHIVRNLVARLDQAALNRLNGFLGRALGAAIVTRTSDKDADASADLRVTYRDTNGELELSSAGAGLVGLVALFAAMERANTERARVKDRPVVFLLDEPEAHLHPRLQGDVGAELAKLAREFGVQLMLATHSVEMINRLGQQDGVTLLAVDRSGPVPVVQLQSERDVISSLANFCDLTPFTSLSFLASRRILFHEGPSDLRILEACARVLFRSDPDRLGRWKRYTPVSLDGVGNASAQGILKSVLTPALFPDIAKTLSVRAVLVRDRDWSRDPVAPQLTKVGKNFESIDVVWSRHCIESLFVDKDVLLAWLEAIFPSPPANLAGLVEAAIATADQDKSLEDDAVDGRALFHQRRDDQNKRLDSKEATKRARAEVRAAGAVWHHGKQRATKVLGQVRDSVPHAMRRLVRADVASLLEEADADKVADPSRAVPAEIAAFLQAVIAP